MSSMSIAPTAPAARITHKGDPVIAAAVMSPVIPEPAASIAVPVPTPVAVAIAAGAPPTGMKCTPPPMNIPPTVIAPINNNGSIIKPPYFSSFFIWSISVSCEYFYSIVDNYQ